MTAQSPRVLVVGAGPAGLAAAAAAVGAGAQVTLLDAADQLGGQYWRHLPEARPSVKEAVLHHGWQHFVSLRKGLEGDRRCEIVTSAQVWAIEQHDDRVAVQVLIGPPDGRDRARRSIVPDALVLATGAHDRTLPFPGWQLPGVYSGGAAQALAKGERVAVGQRVVVAGAGPFLLPVAASLAQTGATVLGVFEASRLRRLAGGWLPRPWRLLGAGKKLGELAGYAKRQVWQRIPYRTGFGVIAAHGGDRVEAVTVARLDANWSPIPGTERRIAVDAVCVSHGFTPRLELAVAAGCALDADGFVEVDAAGMTSAPGVYAAGEITAIGGADAALAQGAVAGHCAAGGLPGDRTIAAAVRARATYSEFAARLDKAHGITPGWVDWLQDQTLICRCEEVTNAQLRGAAELTSSAGLRSLKLNTRAGLGICQGRMCGRSVHEILTRCSEGPLVNAATDRRPIASPVRMGELAAAFHQRETEHQERNSSS